MRKQYIYRNLTKDCFSIKSGGKVVGYITSPVVFGVVGFNPFKVNHKGRERVISERKKYVHAYVMREDEGHTLTNYLPEQWKDYTKREVTYNPFKHTEFVYADSQEPVSGETFFVVLEYPKVYILEDK